MTPKTTETRSAFPRWAIAVIAIGTLLGAGIRWRFLDHPMRYDESYNYLQYASKSPSYIVTHYVPNNHILHTLLVHFTSRLFGEHPAVLRLPAFLFGVLLIPATAWLGWLLSRRVTVSLAAALAVCGSSALVEYSANSRGYSLLALMTVLVLIQSYRILERLGCPTSENEPRRSDREAVIENSRGLSKARPPETSSPPHTTLTGSYRWVLLGVTAALGLWTIPIMALPLAGVSVILMICEVHGRRRIPTGVITMLSVAGGGAILLYSPILITAGSTAVTGATQTAYDVLGKQVTSFSDMTAGAWRLWSRGAGLAWQVLLAMGLIAAVVSIRKQGLKAGILAAAVGGAFLIAAITQAPLPSRTWLFALPIVLVLATSGLAAFGFGDRASALRRAAVYAGLVMLVAMPMTRTPFETRLCSEPGGLVESDPALAECQTFGIDRCAIVAPYSPATAYYMRQRKIPALPTPDAPGVHRVVIVTTPNRKLSELWHSEMAGYNRFGSPKIARIAPFGAVHLADRLDLAAATR